MLNFRAFPVTLIAILCCMVLSTHAQKNSIEEKLEKLESEENYDSMVSLLERTIRYTDVSQEKKNSHLEKLIRTYIKKEDYVNASATSLKWILLLENKPPSALLSKAYALKAQAEYELNNIKTAAHYTEKGYALDYKLKDTVGVIKGLLRMGVLYQEAGDNQKALEYYRLAKRTKNDNPLLKSMLYNALAVALNGIGQKDSCFFYYKKSLEESKKANPIDKEGIILSFSNLSATQTDAKKYTSAITYLDSIRHYKLLNDAKPHLSKIYANYYKAYFKLNNLDSGNHYLQKYINHNEEMFQRKMKSEIAELEVMYDKEKEYLKENQEAKINALNLQKLILVLVIILLIVVISVIIHIYYSNKKKTKIENDKIRIEQRLLRTQMNPHFILNTLAAIQSHVEDNQAEKAAKYLNDFARLMQITLENSTENFISIDSELKALAKYLSLQLMRFENEFDYKIQIEEKLDKSDILIPPMIIQPFVENAIHHGIRNLDRKGKISITVKSIDNAIECTIDDNGRGLVSSANAPKSKQSLSTQIIRQRLEILKIELKKDASVKVINKKEQGESGVKVIITIPYIY